MTDVLQDLDAWIALYPHANIAQRARDEIVTLRELVAEEADRSQEFADHIHARALEQAARVCDQESQTPGQLHAALRCAAAIRALASPPEPSDNE